MLFFKTKKPILSEVREETQDNVDLQIINKMNQEFAISLDLKRNLKYSFADNYYKTKCTSG